MRSFITSFVPQILKPMSHENRIRVSSLLSDSFDVSKFKRSRFMSLSLENMNDEILSTEDILVGTTLALAISFTVSFLQGRSPSSSNIVLWQDSREIEDKPSSEVSSEKVFDGDMWTEISRPENYAVYNKRRLVEEVTDSKERIKQLKKIGDGPRQENKLVLIGLLILFVPIFSVEFFFALSRQFICGDYVTNVDDSMWIIDAKKAAAASNGSSPWAAKLCSPVITIEK